VNFCHDVCPGWLVVDVVWNIIAWISWLNVSVLVGTLALALYNSSKDNQVARMFAYTYAVISVGILVSIYISLLYVLSFGSVGWGAVSSPIVACVYIYILFCSNVPRSKPDALILRTLIITQTVF